MRSVIAVDFDVTLCAVPVWLCFAARQVQPLDSIASEQFHRFAVQGHPGFFTGGDTVGICLAIDDYAKMNEGLIWPYMKFHQ